MANPRYPGFQQRGYQNNAFQMGTYYPGVFAQASIYGSKGVRVFSNTIGGIILSFLRILWTWR